jgi:hypothetical protein
MTQPTALDAIEAAVTAYQQHPNLGFACCSAHPAADAAAALLAEVHRLTAQRKYLIAQLAKQNAESGRGNAALREFLAAEPDDCPVQSRAIDWAADVVDAKLTAEPDHNRASALYELLLHLRGELPCTCARTGGLHAKDCRKYVPGHELISRHNALAAYRRERTATETHTAPTPARP